MSLTLDGTYFQLTSDKPTKDEVREFVHENFSEEDELMEWIPSDWNPTPSFLDQIKVSEYTSCGHYNAVPSDRCPYIFALIFHYVRTRNIENLPKKSIFCGKNLAAGFVPTPV